MSRPPLFRIPTARAARLDPLEPRVMLTGTAGDALGIAHPTILDRGPGTLLTDVHRLTGVDLAHRANMTGAGQTVAVIDSGVAYDHPALGGGYGTSYRVVGGWDFTEENDGDPYDDGPAGYHGTHVTGILASEDAQHLGVAPEADIVALRVFNDQGRGKLSWLEASLQWVVDNQYTFPHPITTVNLSLGTSWQDMELPDYAVLEDELQALRESNIFVAVAAGNQFRADNAQTNHVGLSYPAVSPYVVPAASTNGHGQLSEFSQRSVTSLAVPGEMISSTVPDFLQNFNGKTDDYFAASGTSMAAPYLAGASMLVRQAMQQAGVHDITVGTIYDVLLQTANPIFDAATQQYYAHVDVGRAVEQVLQTSPVQQHGNQLIVTGSAGEDHIHIDTRGFVRVNGRRFPFSVDAIAQIIAHGNGGRDRFTMDIRQPTMKSASDTLFSTGSAVTFQAYEAHWQRDTLSLDADGFERMDFVNHTRELTATFLGSVRRDRFVSQPEYSWMQSGGSLNYVHGATHVVGIANDPHDTVTLYDGPGDDRAQVSPDSARLDTGGFTAIAQGYSSYTLRAFQGGHDTVTLLGTQGDDVLRAKPEYVTLHSDQHSVYAQNFEVRQIEGQGGQDEARLQGSEQDDRLAMSDQHDTLTTPTTHTQLDAFARVDVVGGTGTDTVQYQGSRQQDAFDVRPGQSTAVIHGKLRAAEGFESTDIDAGAGADSIWIHDTPGNDEFRLSGDTVSVHGEAFRLLGHGFEFVHASSEGGDDRAVLIRQQAADRVISDADTLTLQHAMGLLIADNFADTEVRQADDRAVLSAAIALLDDEGELF